MEMTSRVIKLDEKKKFNRAIEIYITNHCNQNCLHCVSSSKKDEQLHMSDKVFEILIDELPRHNIKIVHVTGGEPLLHPNMGQYLHRLLETNLFSLSLQDILDRSTP